jgi:hypothetical protein
VRFFKRGRASLNDDPVIGRSKSATDEETVLDAVVTVFTVLKVLYIIR